MPSKFLCVFLLRLKTIQCANSPQHDEIPQAVRKKTINFLKVTKNRNEVSVYHRIGHACDVSKDCQQKTERQNNWLQHFSRSDDTGLEKENEPYSGMILFVHQEDDTVQNFSLETRSRGDINLYHQPCCHFYEYMHHTKSGDNSANSNYKKYQLVEVVQEDLGSQNIYSHDFAYRPVVALPSTSHDRWRDDEYWWDNQNHNNMNEEYEKLGERAFAGGSHGEVWKAKRRCHSNHLVVNVGTQYQDFRDSRYHKEQCHEGEELIMKRLKVGKEFTMMEAGLREIYFGDILSRNEDSQSLFTTYVDHFFHRGSSDEINDLELWIVFKDAGTSLRSYLYTPVNTGSFVVYQHSAFWTKLRTGSERDEGSSLVALVKGANICADDQGEETKKNNPTYKPNANSEKPPVVPGKRVLKSIIRQLLTSAAKLHERGIVHRDIKPSNLVCKSVGGLSPSKCVLGDFSSAFDEFTSANLYSRGPSPVSILAQI